MPSMMKAACLVETNQPLEITEVSRPEPGPGELLIKLDSCGVCHSDVHYWKGEDSLPDRSRVILGHEGAGVVVEGGAGTSTLPGARVGVGFVYSTCGQCRECRTGNETYCKFSKATGVDVDGCFAEYIVAPENWVTSIPDNISSADAAPLLCAGVTAFSAVSKAQLSPWRKVVIFGLGGVGLYAVQFAKLTGARVYAVDFDDEKLELARRFGAVDAFKPGEEASQKIEAFGGADACLSFAPSPAVMNNMIEAAAPTATLVQVALPSKPFSFVAADIIDKGLTLRGSADGTRLERDIVMGLASAGLVKSSITEIRLDQINDAIRDIDTGKSVGRYVVNY